MMNYSQPVFSQYAIAYGNILALKLYHTLFVLDCSTASENQAPDLLWKLNIPHNYLSAPRIYTRTPAWQLVQQYDLQPSGLTPVGPATRHGIPIYAARELHMLDTQTGSAQWHVEALPPNCTISATDDELVVISPTSNEVQVRSPIDGRILKNYPLPDWWVEATENSAGSIRDFELEPGEEQRWRITVQQNQCVLLRRNTLSSALESFDLSRGETAWSVDLSQNSVVSNPVDGQVAVLSNDDQLQFFDINTGLKSIDLSVPTAKLSRELYLRSSGGQWLVITEITDPEWAESVRPVNNSVPVNGYVYAVDQETGRLSWEQKIHQEHLRIHNTPASPPPPVPSAIPILLLMKRPPQPRPDRPPSYPYQARMIDVRTGKVLYQDEDLGLNLSYHGVRLNHSSNTIEFSFNKRNILFDYSTPSSDSE